MAGVQIPDCVVRPRGPWAVAPQSRGRLFNEPQSPTRTDFQRDRDRIIHSTAFRRLKHKTQVFVAHEGDHYRTRLTHTIEVSQIARSLARSLALDEDLAEALALAHDLGHTPFGHTGEDALDEVMRPYGGFDHNAQSLRIVTRLERRYADFDGLNLAWETLEGLVKHNGPLLGTDGQPTERYRARGIPMAILEYQAQQDLELTTFASAEAQAAAIADDIAYNAHDIDDGLRAGLFELKDLEQVPLAGELLADIAARHPGLDRSRTTHELMRRVITRLVEDVIAEGTTAFTSGRYLSSDDVRHAGRALMAFSERVGAADKGIKGFLYPNMYRHERVMRVRAHAAEVVKRLFHGLFADITLMPAEWCEGLEQAGEDKRARRVADYIAGMTDTFALNEHRRLFGSAPELR
ncbi:deoxyguanosinetriphosphate triphosphohydrolase-like protein [Labrys miyagiensis]|uniref:Deoxyguanosinetriphosphate triphosphohydrolase-like protein n=1 Tax=Labrys miyagiensis TaxID=346912 RepID=A0ABQ6CLH0_9HYPH|nr:deoxyguanosinetriphosphate triphosphohydrolase [Labrys miyagiensis]GLS19107.1 deoxyguanosinetriphosphate triphosphohydrolase-like protein [Labrys miyagiensis]